MSWDDNCRPPRTNTTVPSPIPPWDRPVQNPQVQTVTGDDTISLTTDVTYLDQTAANEGGAPYIVLLPDGTFRRQIKRIYIKGSNAATTQPFQLTSANFMGFGYLLFQGPGAFSAVLEWDGFKWFMIGGDAGKDTPFVG